MRARGRRQAPRGEEKPHVGLMGHDEAFLFYPEGNKNPVIECNFGKSALVFL